MKNPELLSWTEIADIKNPLWAEFLHKEQLTALQLKQFQHYYALLITWNKHINITRIITLPDVIAYYFSDSLRLGDSVLLREQVLVDVGSGGGFPGIPLAIKYPSLHITLIEVTLKKVKFLRVVIDTLGLTTVTIDTRDWFTFVHHTMHTIDYVCARASLSVPDLLHMYTNPLLSHTLLVYWASAQWHISKAYNKYILREYAYSVGDRKRRLIFLKKPTT
jgi:16S rRNA (guanine(527)-N(7))-methyltransferase RsmG